MSKNLKKKKPTEQPLRVVHDETPDNTIDIKSKFIVQSANTWIDLTKDRPKPKMLFGEFFHEGEICILFADTNLGKSILAVQIGNSIASGKPVRPFAMTAKSQKVLYFDFELSDMQFATRYTGTDGNHFKFSQNFLRSEFNPSVCNGNEDCIIDSIEEEVVKNDVRVVIIDNITFLNNASVHASKASVLMKQLKVLKQKHNLSILVLAHTPKRNRTLPISSDDLHGSKILMNFCDSAFAIGQSQADASIRYIKQIKQRITEKMYGEGNICVCQIIQPLNYLQFEFIKFDEESEYLYRPSKISKEERDNKIIELSFNGKSCRAIAMELGVSPMTVSRALNPSTGI